MIARLRSVPLLLILPCLALLVSCSILRDPAQAATLTAEALPTSTLPPELATQDLRLASPRSCLLDQFTSIVTQTPQGNLLAWSPQGDLLAMVVPDNGRWGWFIGNASIYDVAAKKELYATQGNVVYGDVTWSPSADYLAFVKFSADTKLYTIMTLRMSDHALVDYFPGDAARTDDFSSLKGIASWNTTQQLVVSSSCGSDCSRFYNIDVTTGRMTVLSEKRKSEDPSLALDNQFISPDGQLKVLADNQGMSWLAALDQHSTYLLAQSPIDEMKWSPDSKYFAFRLVDQVSIYKVSCP